MIINITTTTGDLTFYLDNLCLYEENTAQTIVKFIVCNKEYLFTGTKIEFENILKAGLGYEKQLGMSAVGIYYHRYFYNDIDFPESLDENSQDSTGSSGNGGNGTI